MNTLDTYWDKKGCYQETYDRLQELLVPPSGPALTVAGELLRLWSNAYYDVFNNGGCNLGDSRKGQLAALASLANELELAQVKEACAHLAKLGALKSWAGAPRNRWGDFDEEAAEERDAQAEVLLNDDAFNLLLERATDELVIKAEELDRLTSQLYAARKGQEVSDG